MILYKYKKITDQYTTYAVTVDNITELCTISGVTYISGPDPLPPQPEQITVTPMTLTPELKDAIKAASPHVKLITTRMQERIRARYSLADEQYFARIGTGVVLGVYIFQAGEQDELVAFNTFVESVRQWGRDQRVALGL